MSSLIDISPLVHPGISVWPGDVNFERKVMLDTDKGDNLTLSSIHTTVHVGAHTDAPNHYGGKAGISEVGLEAYWGKCQVIHIKKKVKCITPDLLSEIRAPRVLFRTGSFPNPDHFNTDFTALSAALIQMLSKQKVQLVGIDTPSIDPFESKDLPAHHAVLAAKMAILEGIVLEDVSEGVYELCALPLKLQNTDASPVRAVLKRV